MKTLIGLVILVCMLSPALVLADEFLGAPLPPGGQVTVSTPKRIEKKYEMGYADAVKFYKDAFKKDELVKFWDRGDETYIEEHGNRPWHSVTITPLEKGGTEIVILKDNWTWIIGTLVIRFVGVFGVLCVLYIALTISGRIMARLTSAKQNAGAGQGSTRAA
jgi:hypothetical protein